MSLESFQLVNGGSDWRSVLGAVQRNIERVYRPLQRNPLLGGLLLDEVGIVPTGTDVEHHLPQACQGYVIVGMDAAATVYRAVQSAELERRLLHLVSSTTVYVKLYVF